MPPKGGPEGCHLKTPLPHAEAWGGMGVTAPKGICMILSDPLGLQIRPAPRALTELHRAKALPCTLFFHAAGLGSCSRMESG